MLQGADSVAGPIREQSFPPNSGAGLLHFRVLVFVPLPHVLLQDP